MSMWNRFDFKAAIVFSENKKNADAITKEFDRVGIDPIRFWSCPLPYEKVVEDNVRHTRMCSGSHLSITLNQHRVVKTAYRLGVEHVLIFEDDIRMLKDISLLEKIVKALPEDYDVALFDWVHRGKASEEDYQQLLNAERINGYWAPFKDLRSTAMWSLSRKGMEEWLRHQEKTFYNQGKMRLCDQYYWFMKEGCPDMKMYCAFPCGGVQGVPGQISNYDSMWNKYTRSGMVRDNYSPVEL